MAIPFFSYPKSGRTWFRFMIDDYLVRLSGTAVSNVFDIEKRPVILSADSSVAPMQYPFEWTHLTGAMLMDLPYDMMGAIKYSQFDGQRMIFLTRDFHDTMASAYRHAMYRIKRWDGSASDFLRSPIYGFIKLVTLYNMWERIHPRLSSFEIVSYEETKDNPLEVVRRCLVFAGASVREDVLAESVEAGSFDRMRALSTTPDYANTPLAPADPSNPQSFKVRAGGSEQSAHSSEVFNQEDREFMDRLAEALLVNPRAEYVARCFGTAFATV